jgi:hypothetical protein
MLIDAGDLSLADALHDLFNLHQTPPHVFHPHC